MPARSSKTKPLARPSAGSRRGHLHRATVETLRRLIVRGELPPGEKLREEALCRRLAVSRTPLREAIRTLAGEGLVRLTSNRSAKVAELDLDSVEHLFHVVAALESFAAIQACRLATAAEIAALAVLHERMRAHHARGDRAGYFELNLRIHRGLVAAARNPVLLAVYDTLLPRLERVRFLPNLKPRRWPAAMREHEEMLAALRARDESRLSALMEAHWRNGAMALRQLADTPAGVARKPAADRARRAESGGEPLSAVRS